MRPRVTTAVLAAATLVVSFAFSYGPGTVRMSLSAAVVISVTAAVTVWLSGRRPALALALVAALAVALPLIRSTFQALDLVVVVVLFQAALRSSLPPALTSMVGFAALTVNDAWQRLATGTGFMEPSVLYPALFTGLAVAAGLLSRRVLADNVRLLALRDADRLRAVSDERRRIARDLHDVAAHHLSALVVHNRLAQRLATPEAFREASEFTTDTAAAALDSMRQVVAVLATDGQAPHSPQPRLDQLGEVLARMRGAGLQIDHPSIPVPMPQVPVRPDVEVAVVRIAQEALANVLRHRGPGRCWVELHAGLDLVSLCIEDDGPSTPPPAMLNRGPGTGGWGLIGMRERAVACGGRLVVDASPRGGWRVSAQLPGAVA